MIIIGAEKCGTSALYYYLAQHPEVFMSREKELRFFDGRNWERGVAWYESKFDGAAARVRGEASPQYTFHPGAAGTPERMQSVVPDAKLIYLVRDPIERIVSAYVAEYAAGREHRTLRETITPLVGSHYVSVSSYAIQLERYLRHFPRKRILVVSREELLHMRRPTLRRVFGFLGVDARFDSDQFDRIRNPSDDRRRVRPQVGWLPANSMPAPVGRVPWEVRAQVKRLFYRPFTERVARPAVPKDLRHGLVEVLKPDADRFRQITGRAFAEWSI
jgi:hypothetical protein